MVFPLKPDKPGGGPGIARERLPDSVHTVHARGVMGVQASSTGVVPVGGGGSVLAQPPSILGRSMQGPEFSLTAEDLIARAPSFAALAERIDELSLNNPTARECLAAMTEEVQRLAAANQELAQALVRSNERLIELTERYAMLVAGRGDPSC